MHGADGRLLTIRPQTSQQGLYSCVVTNIYGAVTSSPAMRTVVPVWINIQPQTRGC